MTNQVAGDHARGYNPTPDEKARDVLDGRREL